MLRIDRVKTEMEVVPSGNPSGSSSSGSASRSASELLSDPGTRDRLKDLVLEVLRDHLRALERRGVV
jgi:hypothetical protein